MKYDYYKHMTCGHIGDYFGEIGYPVTINIVMFYVLKFFGYRVTRCLKGVSLKRIMIRSNLASGTHRRSYAMREILNEKYWWSK